MWVLVLGACYEPKLEAACEVRCTVNPSNPDERGPCPSGLACAADGLCRGADGTCGGVQPDGPLALDAPPGSTCYGTNPIFRPCLLTPPTGLPEVSFIDTSEASSCTAVLEQTTGGDPVCLIAGESVSVANARIIGDKPLVVLATTNIVLTTSIDVSSRPNETGAGANYAGCVPGTPPGGGSGGGGGSFQRAGGTGGSSDGALPGNPNTPTPEPLSIVRGGCRGANGGNLASEARGAGGASGGSILFIAPTIIAGGATINASGQGGQGGAVLSGGGGGGSGGLIVFDATTELDLSSAVVLANGGGGGQGGASGTLGANGAEPTSHDMAAPGGSQVPGAGGAGGAGSVGAGMGTSAGGTAPMFGAGGGGGGAGYVFIYGPRTNVSTSISPPPRP